MHKLSCRIKHCNRTHDTHDTQHLCHANNFQLCHPHESLHKHENTLPVCTQTLPTTPLNPQLIALRCHVFPFKFIMIFNFRTKTCQIRNLRPKTWQSPRQHFWTLDFGNAVARGGPTGKPGSARRHWPWPQPNLPATP